MSEWDWDSGGGAGGSNGGGDWSGGAGLTAAQIAALTGVLLTKPRRVDLPEGFGDGRIEDLVVGWKPKKKMGPGGIDFGKSPFESDVDDYRKIAGDIDDGPDKGDVDYITGSPLDDFTSGIEQVSNGVEAYVKVGPSWYHTYSEGGRTSVTRVTSNRDIQSLESTGWVPAAPAPVTVVTPGAAGATAPGTGGSSTWDTIVDFFRKIFSRPIEEEERTPMLSGHQLGRLHALHPELDPFHFTVGRTDPAGGDIGAGGDQNYSLGTTGSFPFGRHSPGGFGPSSPDSPEWTERPESDSSLALGLRGANGSRATEGPGGMVG